MGQRPFARLSQEDPETAWLSDRRLSRRRRTRLRSGKLFDEEGRFLMDCQLVDRSLLGVRIATGFKGDLPVRLALYDEERGEICDAEIVWRAADLCGISLRGRPRSGASVRARFGGLFYAMERHPEHAR